MPSTPRAAHPAGGACGAPGHRARHVVRGVYAGKRALAGQCPATTVDTLNDGGFDKGSFHIRLGACSSYSDTLLAAEEPKILADDGREAREECT
jgi:hypothetical protein